MKTTRHTLMAVIAVLAVLLSVTVLTVSASRIRGDVDRSGALSSSDVRTMMRYMLGNRSLSAEEWELADCDGNGRVDTLDARYVYATILSGETPATLPTTTTTVATTTTTKSPFDDDGYYDEVVKP